MSKSQKFLLVLPILTLLLTTSCYGSGAVDCHHYDDSISRFLGIPRKPLPPECDGVKYLIPDGMAWIIVFAFALLTVAICILAR